MVFSYGCAPKKQNETPTIPQFDFYVYRIAHINEDGYEVDLSMSQVEARCEQLGFKMVPKLMEPFIYDGDKEKLVNKLKPFTEGPDPIDNSHMREGIVVKVEHKDMSKNIKYKGSDYCLLEQIQKQDPLFLDTEEVS